MLDSILKILQREDQLQQTVCVQLKRRRIVSAFGHVVRLVEDNYRIFVVQRVVWPHGLVEHIVVGHQNKVGGGCSLLVHVEWADFVLYRDSVKVFDVVGLGRDTGRSLRILVEEFALARLYRPIATILQVVSLNAKLAFFTKELTLNS